MEELPFPNCTRNFGYMAKGRNGLMKCRGFSFYHFYLGDAGVVRVYPRTSRGNDSEACFIEIPVGQIDTFCEKLKLEKAKK